MTVKITSVSKEPTNYRIIHRYYGRILERKKKKKREKKPVIFINEDTFSHSYVSQTVASKVGIVNGSFTFRVHSPFTVLLPGQS